MKTQVAIALPAALAARLGALATPARNLSAVADELLRREWGMPKAAKTAKRHDNATRNTPRPRR